MLRAALRRVAELPDAAWQLGFFAWGTLVWLGSATPDLALASSCAVWPDALHYLARKAIHVGEFAVLGALAVRASGARSFRARLGIWTLVVLWGALDETHQSFVPGRTPSPIDISWDALGAVLGILVAGNLPRQ